VSGGSGLTVLSSRLDRGVGAGSYIESRRSERGVFVAGETDSGLVGFAVGILQLLVHFSVVGRSVFVLHFPRLHLSVSLDSCAVSSQVFDFAWTSKNQNCRLSLICLHELLASCHFDLQFQNLNLKFS
jgi:hypothetical protein